MGNFTINGFEKVKPLIHFFVLGLVVFGLKAWFEKPAEREGKRRVEISSADLEWFRTLWKKRMGREPTGGELRDQIDQLTRLRILGAEAEGLGLDENDPVVMRRLAQKMDYMFKDMAAGILPTNEELEVYLDKHRPRYEIPGETTFEQVLFTTDERGEAGAELAVAMFLDHPNRDSDPTMLPRMNEELSPIQIQGLYGKEFSIAMRETPVKNWSGPLRSSYGLHAVLVHERSPTVLPSVEDIRDRLTADWSADKQIETATSAYQEIRATYQVLVEGMPYTLDMK